MSQILILHLISTSIMFGVIWVVQLVHYPLFNFVRSEDFVKFEKSHCDRITFIVLPAMGIELISGLYLFLINSDSLFFQINLSLLLLTWLSTFFIQVRHHKILSNGFNEETHIKLVKYNWIRTILWSIRILLLIYISAYGS